MSKRNPTYTSSPSKGRNQTGITTSRLYWYEQWSCPRTSLQQQRVTCFPPKGTRRRRKEGRDDSRFYISVTIREYNTRTVHTHTYTHILVSVTGCTAKINKIHNTRPFTIGGAHSACCTAAGAADWDVKSSFRAATKQGSSRLLPPASNNYSSSLLTTTWAPPLDTI